MLSYTFLSLKALYVNVNKYNNNLYFVFEISSHLKKKLNPLRIISG